MQSVPVAQAAQPHAASPQPARVKPRLRGASHHIAAYVAALATAILCSQVPAGRATWSVLVYGVCMTALFAISAAYHLPMWQPGPRQWMRRLDHCAIYLQIAGTYTPICLLALSPSVGEPLLLGVWIAATAGIAKSLVWIKAPKLVSAALYVALGWAAMACWSELKVALGETGVALMVGGGVLYTVGAAIYAVRKPDPMPQVFGYHEVFHALVIAAATCHFVMVGRVAT